MKSIKLKLVLIYLALVFIVMIISGTFMLVNTRFQETNKVNESLKSYVRYIEEQVIQDYPREDFQDGMKNLQRGTNKIEGNILNYEGETIASNVSTEMKYVNPAIISALAGTEDYGHGKDADTTGLLKDWIYYAYPVMDEDNKVKYVIFARMNAEPILSSLLDQAATLAFTIVFALLMTGLLGVLFANTITGPIIMLTKKSKDMALGDFEQKIPVSSVDEIGQLTESFNFMAEELSTTMSTMESEKNKMSILLHNMTDGVLAYDSAGALIHANFSCQELLNSVDIEKIPFKQMMGLLGINVDSANLKNLNFNAFENASDSILHFGDKFISANFAPYYGSHDKIEGLVIVLQDITKHKKLDDMRKEFVANVSHELRTPLTTIKSYTETLLDGALDDHETAVDFLNVIEQESNRMTLLVHDLLELSRFDNKQLKLELKKIDLVVLLKLCIRQNSILAQNKNQEIIFEPPAGTYAAMVDESRINQVFTNIISNAIKYSNDNSKIEIIAEETDRYYRFYIKDSGIGIPKEDLRRVFERFYRVDKARSRAMGGTGLGLAIAKEIMDAHDGKIFANSELGRGTTMILRFNKLGLNRDED